MAVFVAVARSGQVAKAALQLSLSPPATSMSLQELERQLACQLFIRKGNRLLLNARGEHLLPLAMDILDRVEDVEQSFNPNSGVFAGSIRISASSTIGNYLLAGASVKFQLEHPQSNCELLIGNTQKVITSILEGHSEVGYIEGHCPDRRLNVSLWHQDKLVVFCAPEHRFANQTVSAQHLMDVPWVLRESGSGTREVFVNTMLEQGVQPQLAFSFNTADAIKQAVKQGGGLGVLSGLIVNEEIAKGWLAPVVIDNVNLDRSFYRIHHKSRTLSALASHFDQFCVERWLT
nr:LysR substrate-binding domain-containing protein [Shewanella sp. NIFS-20-20]